MKKSPVLSKTLALVAPVTILSSSTTFGASDYYLKIEGIKGESADARHKDWIELSSFSWGLSNPSAAGTGAGTGKVSLQDFHFTMTVDKASPKLMLACATGSRIPTLQFIVARPDDATGGTGATTDYYVITLSDVLVSSYESSSPMPTAGSPAGPLTASVRFNYMKIRWDYIAADKETVSVEYATPSSN